MLVTWITCQCGVMDSMASYLKLIVASPLHGVHISYFLSFITIVL